MSLLNQNIQCVADHYQNDVLDYQKTRLEQESPVEYAITRRVMDRWIADHSNILYIGVGVGHYAEHLARRGCKIHLVDICESFLNLANERMIEAGFESSILGSTLTSGSDLKSINDESFDIVLLMGPLYHITSVDERQKAIAESYRALKTGGLLFAAGINKLAVLHELFTPERFFGAQKLNLQKIENNLKEFTESGICTNTVFSPLGDAYTPSAQEFKSMFIEKFNQLEFLGVESFSAFNQKKLLELSTSDQAIWLDLIQKTARTDDGIGCSEHFLYVGRKQ